jgi:hypothetical protein
MPRGEIVLRKEVKRLGDSASQVSISHSLFSAHGHLANRKRDSAKTIFLLASVRNTLSRRLLFWAETKFKISAGRDFLRFIGAVKILLSLRD